MSKLLLILMTISLQLDHSSLLSRSSEKMKSCLSSYSIIPQDVTQLKLIYPVFDKPLDFRDEYYFQPRFPGSGITDFPIHERGSLPNHQQIYEIARKKAVSKKRKGTKNDKDIREKEMFYEKE